MSEHNQNQPDDKAVRYELSLDAHEALEGATKVLIRNGKRLEVVVPPGVSGGSIVKLTNALQLTDSRPGDILVQVKIKEPVSQSKSSGSVIEITDSDFDKHVLEAELPVVVDFWAPWCGPCRMMAPILEQAAAQYQGRFKFCKINVDENQVSAGRYRAMSIPLLVFFKKGKVVDQSLGAIPAVQLKNKLDGVLSG
ncbi:MAG TPA: thioredoxin [Dehalococcoidales bacterium]|nr:thioredoxin [Dehalococcoidales bacterium]